MFKLIIILLILWALGFSFNFGGGIIHTLLVIALIALIIKLLS